METEYLISLAVIWFIYGIVGAFVIWRDGRNNTGPEKIYMIRDIILGVGFMMYVIASGGDNTYYLERLFGHPENYLYITILALLYGAFRYIIGGTTNRFLGMLITVDFVVVCLMTYLLGNLFVFT